MKNNKKIITLYIIGVLTLITAIAGATYAFFSATYTDNNSIQGSTASTDITLTVTPVSSGIDNDLIPQLSSDIGNAVIGTGGNSCVDSNGNTVCKVYEILVENIGTAQLEINATLTFVAEYMENLKWGKGTGNTTGFSEANTYSKTENDLINPALSGLQSVTLPPSDGVTGSGNDTIKFYIVVYIEETNSIQTDSGSFYGTVSISAAGGSGISATFNA